MIYTVTLNPSLDYIVDIEDFKTGRTNRANKELVLAGGKGINVSVVLKNLGLESTALGFAAGFTGDEIIRKLSDLGVHSEFIFLDSGYSRINVKLRYMDGTEINAQGPEIDAKAVEKLMTRLDALTAGDILFLSGSVPVSMSDDTYEKIIAMLAERDVLVVVDATKDLLLNVLKYHPFLIKPNHHELEEIFGVTFTDRQSVISYGKKLQSMGARNVLISMAGNGAVLVAGDGQIYESAAPVGTLVNAVGAGDSMVAGFMAGYIEKHDIRYAFYMGLAAGSASAFSEKLATKAEIMALLRQLPVD